MLSVGMMSIHTHRYENRLSIVSQCNASVVATTSFLFLQVMSGEQDSFSAGKEWTNGECSDISSRLFCYSYSTDLCWDIVHLSLESGDTARAPVLEQGDSEYLCFSDDFGFNWRVYAPIPTPLCVGSIVWPSVLVTDANVIYMILVKRLHSTKSSRCGGP